MNTITRICKRRSSHEVVMRRQNDPARRVLLGKGHLPRKSSEMTKRISTPYDWAHAVDEYNKTLALSSIHSSANENNDEFFTEDPTRALPVCCDTIVINGDGTSIAAETGISRIIVEETRVDVVRRGEPMEKLKSGGSAEKETQTDFIKVVPTCEQAVGVTLDLVLDTSWSQYPEDFLADYPLPVEPISFPRIGGPGKAWRYFVF